MSNYVLTINNSHFVKTSTDIRYFNYATQFDDDPSPVSANTVGDGSAGSIGNFANFNRGADWNGQDGNVTTVETNGSSSFYGTFDQCGQVWEWNDSVIGTARGVRGGSWLNSIEYIGSSYSGFTGSSPSFGNANVGFRISASSVATTNLLELIKIGNTNNIIDNTGYGSVSYVYQIAKYPITNNQFAVFLNLKAQSDPNSLYNSNMGSNIRGGITRSGSNGSYTYSVKTNMGDKPVVYMSWFRAARFANWLHNGGGAGSTETGAYDLNGATAGVFTKNSGAIFWIPSEDEWYKAAFYKHANTFKVG
jgi:formylglycine-generating enzyme required for sulfatase activity